MRTIRIEPEIAVQQKQVCIIIVLVSAQSALQTQCADMRPKRAQIQRRHIPRHLGNPVAQILRAARHHRVRVLVAAIDGEPVLRRHFRIDSNAAAFNLPKVLAQQQDRRRVRISRYRDNGPIDLGVKIARADGPPAPLTSDASLPSSCALAQQRRIGQRELVTDLR